MTAMNRLTIKLAEVILDRLEHDSRYPITPATGEKSQREHRDLAALLIAARMETPEVNDPPEWPAERAVVDTDINPHTASTYALDVLAHDRGLRRHRGESDMC